MKSTELRSFLKSLDLTRHGYTIDLVEVDDQSPEGIVMCNMTLGYFEQTEKTFDLRVQTDASGQLLYTHNIHYDKGDRPERLSAALIELCNQLNMNATARCSWIVGGVEMGLPYFTIAVARSLSIPASYYERRKEVARELHALNIDHFVDEALYLHGELATALARLSESGLFDNENVDAEDVVLPGEQ